jgi:adenosylcobinamide-phosphate synthase
MFPLFSQSAHAPDGLMLLFMAIALDAALGEMGPLFRLLPHPVVLIGRVIGGLDRRLNRADRPPAERRRRGILVALSLALGALGVGAVIAFLARTLPHAWLFEIFVAATLIAQRSLFEHVHDVAVALKENGLEAGRYAVSRIVGRDPQSLDSHGVVRAAIESLAENFADGVVAPVFWYAFLGLPGLILYKTINTADSMIGHLNDKYRDFGMASARLDDLMNLIPARLAGMLLVLAAPFILKGHPLKALVTMVRDSGHHRSPNSGWPEAAAAGALDLALGGPRKYPGLVVDEKWIGSGRARAEISDIQRALHLYTVACLIQAGCVIFLLWLQA